MNLAAALMAQRIRGGLQKQQIQLNEAAARRALLRWFRRYARPLPWRKSPSPYAIWVSEVMLQQTQVATVIPYFRRFVRAFPTVTSLARARLEHVLELWSGLGYYRRARHLHRAAQVLVRDFHGIFPRELRQARSLPGIGDYTARAVLSIAYNLPYAVLEGNVARVVARLHAIRGSLHQPHFRRTVERELDGLLSRPQPGNFNQALMELGQTVCLPRAPRCPVCPLQAWCRAFQRGQPQEYPTARPRRAAELHHLATAIIRRGEQVAMVRGLDEGLLGDLWNFPSAFGPTRAAAVTRLQEKLATLVPGAAHIGVHLSGIRHRITHRVIRVDPYRVEIDTGTKTNGLRWLSLSRLSRAAISQLTRKIAAQIRED
jgi:A/G-specific adenine glycosylase